MWLDPMMTYMSAMCSEISAQNWGTSWFNAFSAYCLSTGSGSESSASTPAAEDCEGTPMVASREGR